MIHMPLDLDRESYQLAGAALDAKLSQLDDQGWNTKGEIRAYAVLRWSVIISKIREDMLEALLGPSVADRRRTITYVCFDFDAEEIGAYQRVVMQKIAHGGRKCME